MIGDTRAAREHLVIPTPTGDRLDAWLYLPEGSGPHATVVMAHGIGGIKAAGLAPFAEHFRAAGFAALVFDYRHWGRSEGQPRELLSIKKQRDDYRSALAWTRADDRLDSERLIIWGTSFAGMHVTELAATEPGIRAAIAQCPLVDGLAGVRLVPLSRTLRLSSHALADASGSLFGRAPRYLPISVAPGEVGMIATSDALIGLERLRPEEDPWPNRVTARSLLEITRTRPVRNARRITCPILMVVAEHDTMAPTGPAKAVAIKAPRGELYRSRGGHYDVYAGGTDHERVLEVQAAFLNRHAGP